VLPAFGSFTGGFLVNGLASDETIYVVADGRVLQVR
jgi:hypothetical protein